MSNNNSNNSSYSFKDDTDKVIKQDIFNDDNSKKLNSSVNKQIMEVKNSIENINNDKQILFYNISLILMLNNYKKNKLNELKESNNKLLIETRKNDLTIEINKLNRKLKTLTENKNNNDNSIKFILDCIKNESNIEKKGSYSKVKEKFVNNNNDITLNIKNIQENINKLNNDLNNLNNFDNIPIKYIKHKDIDHNENKFANSYLNLFNKKDRDTAVGIVDNNVNTNIINKDKLLISKLEINNIKHYSDKFYSEKHINELLRWQYEIVIKEIGSERNNLPLIYTAPTSAGKTLISELILIDRVEKNLNKHLKHIYVVPLISLAKEKKSYFKKLFKGKLNVKGFYDKIPVNKYFDLAICSIEKVPILINHLNLYNEAKDLNTIIIDEIHMIADENRGPSICSIITLIKLLSPDCKIIGMSATIDNLDIFRYILPKSKLYKCKYVPVTLQGKYYYYDNFSKKLTSYNPSIKEVKCDDYDLFINMCIYKFYSVKDTCIFCFCSSRKKCYDYLNKFINYITTNNYIIKCGIETSNDLIVNKNYIQYGLAIHNSDLSMHERVEIEKLIYDNKIKVVFATSTLAIGVNFPASAVFILDLIVGIQPLRYDTFKQMIGRCGRIGFNINIGKYLVFANNFNPYIDQKELLEKFIKNENIIVENKLTINANNLDREILEIFGTRKVDNFYLLTNILLESFYCIGLETSEFLIKIKNSLLYLYLNDLITFYENQIILTQKGNSIIKSSIKINNALKILWIDNNINDNTEFYEMFLLTFVSDINKYITKDDVIYALNFLFDDLHYDINDCKLLFTNYLNLFNKKTRFDEYADNFSDKNKKYYLKLYFTVLYYSFYKRVSLKLIKEKFKLSYGEIISIRNQFITNTYILKSFLDEMKIIKKNNVLNIIINNLNPDINPNIKTLMNIDGMLLSIANTLVNNKIDTIEKVYKLNESQIYSFILQSKSNNDFNDFDSKLICGKSLKGIIDLNLDDIQRAKLIKKSCTNLIEKDELDQVVDIVNEANNERTSLD